MRGFVWWVFINFSHRSPRTLRFFFETIVYVFFFSFTMVIKLSAAWELRGGSAAFGDRPASSMSKYSPVCTLTSEMGHFGSIEIHEAEHVNRCRWRSTRVWSHQLTSTVCNFHTGILPCVVDYEFINFSHRSPKTFRFFSFFETLFYNFFFVLPWWSNDLENFVENLLHLTIISIQYVQIQPGVKSDLGNGSFWVEIHDAKHVDRLRQVKIYTGLIASTYLSPHRCLPFWKCIQWSCLKTVLVPTFVQGGLRGSNASSGSCLLRP